MPFSDHALTRWLMALALLHVAGGLALPVLVLQTAWLDWALPELVTGPGARVVLALFGPTVASWGVLLAFLVHFGIRFRQRWACDALIVAVLVWLPLDAALCWSHGIAGAIVIDLLAAPALLVPALILRRRFAPVIPPVPAL